MKSEIELTTSVAPKYIYTNNVFRASYFDRFQKAFNRFPIKEMDILLADVLALNQQIEMQHNNNKGYYDAAYKQNFYNVMNNNNCVQISSYGKQNIDNCQKSL